ncbi:MAG: SDR family oxidoreductase [Nevskiaceae bacterium]|nr:MAG: SDR family oxidoreductase [Nevskiaceae bacterium]TBR72079.1 MAG: SDR family oxidoreductase [Nevskiaceae bacterium]
MPQPRTLRRGDVELAVYEWPTTAESAPVVLLVHGYPDSASVWRHVAPLLAGHCRVVAYDVRGAGHSTHPNHTAAYALEELVADMAAVVDDISPDAKVHLVAHDWGSIQGWEAVTTQPLAARIASYTCFSGPSLDHAGYWIAQRLRHASPAALSQLGRQLAHSWYVGAFHFPGVFPTMWKAGLDHAWPQLLAKLERVQTEASETQRADGVDGIKLYRANFRQRLSSPSERYTNVPVQLLWPRHDHFMVPEIWDDLPRWVSRLWRRDVDAGHWLQLSHPQLVADYVTEFVHFIETGKESAGLKRAGHRAAAMGKPDAGKLVVITGAGSGIGRETALLYAERGAEVVAVDVDEAAAQRTAELAELLGGMAWARAADVGSTKDMETLATWVRKELGTPDIVVNNAGIGMAGSVLDTSVADWEKILHVNLWGVIHGSRLFAQQMVASKNHGHIVNVSSGLAFFPSPMTPAYATTKAAVRMLTECLRAELGGKGIGVSAVYPGVVNTGIVSRTRFVGTTDVEQQRRQSKVQRLYERRNLKPEAVAAAIVDAVEHDRPEVLVGVETVGIRTLSRLSPALWRRLARSNIGM